MSLSSDHSHHSVRRIVLPSGRAIEVVRFSDVQHAAGGLHVCPACDSALVQPLSWSEAGDGVHWELTLECPNCWWTHTGTFDQSELAAFEDELDEGVAKIVRDLQRMTHANMSDQIDRFVTALEADVILPEDF